MKERLTNSLIWIFLVFVAVASFRGYIKSQNDNKRLLFDLKAAQQKAQQFTTRDGHEASKLISQDLTARELKTAFPKVTSQLKNLYIPPRLAVSYTETSQQMKVEVKAPVKDSIKPIPGKQPEAIKTFAYSDKWLSLRGVIHNDTTAIKLAATDSIFTAIYKGARRHPWAWLLSKRQLTAAATNRNPYIKINVIQSGVIKK